MGKNLLFSALGIGRATVLCNNAGLANPFKAGRSQGVCAAGTAKDCRCFMGSPMGANGVRPVGRAEAMVALTI